MVAAVERAYRELPATWDADTEDKVFGLPFDLFRNVMAGFPLADPIIGVLADAAPPRCRASSPDGTPEMGRGPSPELPQ